MEKKLSKRVVILIIVLCVIISASVIAVINRDNISAVIKAFKYSESEIEKMVEESSKKLESEIAEKYPNMVGNFTPEEEAKIMSGEMTVEEAIELKIKEFENNRTSAENADGNSGEKVSANDKNKNNTTTGNLSDVDEKTEKIASAKIIEFYSLKAYYLGQLGQLEAKVIADYSALPDSKKNLVGKKEVAGKYMSVANSLLVQCDSRVATLLGELESEIKAVGGDLSIISTIKNAYENEKNLKKAYYMSKLK